MIELVPRETLLQVVEDAKVLHHLTPQQSGFLDCLAEAYPRVVKGHVIAQYLGIKYSPALLRPRLTANLRGSRLAVKTRKGLGYWLEYHSL